MLSDSSILKKIQCQPKQTAGYKQLVRELGLHGGERRELNDRLQKLVLSGQLVAADSDRFAIPQAPSGKNLVAGKLSLHRDGFGFVIPELSSAAPSLKGRLSGDIFVPPHTIGAAMHGDRVLVEVTNVRPDGRAEGRLVRSIQRAHPTVVGVFHYGARNNYVTPLDAKIGHEIVIPEGMEILGEASSVVGPRSLAKAQDGEVKGNDTQSAKRKSGVVGTSSETADGRNTAHLPTTDDRRPTTKSKHRVLGNEAARRNDWSDLENVVVDV